MSIATIPWTQRKRINLTRILLNNTLFHDRADIIVARGQTDDMTKRDFMKLQAEAAKERKKAANAAADYRRAVDDCELTRQKWEEDMRQACAVCIIFTFKNIFELTIFIRLFFNKQEFQSAEEERINFTKEILTRYLNIQRDVNVKCKEVKKLF